MDQKAARHLNLPTTGSLIKCMVTSDTEPQFDWSNQELSVREFDETYATSLPVVIRVTQGYMGANDTHTFGNDEVFLIFGKRKQKRAVLKDSQNRHISIPLNHHVKLHVVRPDGSTEAAKRLGEILKEYHRSSGNRSIYNQLTAPLMLRYEERPGMNFTVIKESELQSTVQFGNMHYVDTYEENYLFGFNMIHGRLWITEQPSILPVYLPVCIDVAKGIVGSTSDKWRGVLEKFVKHLIDVDVDHILLNACKEIVVLSTDGCPKVDKGQYQYIHPSNFIVPTIGRKTILLMSSDDDNEYDKRYVQHHRHNNSNSKRSLPQTWTGGGTSVV